MEWVGNGVMLWLTNTLIQGHIHHEPHRSQPTHISSVFAAWCKSHETWDSASKHTKRKQKSNNNLLFNRLIIGGALSSAKLWSFVAYKFKVGNLKSKVRTQFASYASAIPSVIISMHLCPTQLFFLLLGI